MPRPSTGTTYRSGDRFYASLTVAPSKRRSFHLATCRTEKAAEMRKEDLAKMLAPLRKAGVDVDTVIALLERAAARPDGPPFEEARRLAAELADGDWTPKRRDASRLTFQELGERWTSGALAKEHPDHVRVKKSAPSDVSRLEQHVYPHVATVPIVTFTIDHAEEVMRALPSTLAASTRRHVGQLMHRILAFAVYPLRILAANPLPTNFLPKLSNDKAKSYLYPDDDRKLLACEAIAIARRLLYGVLAREGLRFSEAARLTWSDVDLDRGILTLDENKTDTPRAWALDPGVVRALRVWRALSAGRPRRTGRASRAADRALDASAPIFISKQGQRFKVSDAKAFREHLQRAGVTRAILFSTGKNRLRIRVHDLRATFITLNLAAGRTETWITDRSGHTTSQQLQHYRRLARTAAELNLGMLDPLDEAIPELVAHAATRATTAPHSVAGNVARGAAVPRTVKKTAGKRAGSVRALMDPFSEVPSLPSETNGAALDAPEACFQADRDEGRRGASLADDPSMPPLATPCDDSRARSDDSTSGERVDLGTALEGYLDERRGASPVTATPRSSSASTPAPAFTERCVQGARFWPSDARVPASSPRDPSAAKDARAALLERLLDDMRAAIARGDEDEAAALHAAIGGLLAPAADRSDDRTAGERRIDHDDHPLARRERGGAGGRSR